MFAIDASAKLYINRGPTRPGLNIRASTSPQPGHAKGRWFIHNDTVIAVGNAYLRPSISAEPDDVWGSAKY